MDFEVKTVLDAKTLVDYQKIAGKTVLRKKTVLTRGALFLAGVLGLTICAVGVATSGVNVTVMLGTLLSGLCVALGAVWYNYTTWRVSRKTPSGLEQTFFFSGENLVASAGERRVVHGYRDFVALAESGGYFVLFLNSRSGYILPKSGFLKGTPEQFGPFIEEKTGRKLAPANL